VVEVLKTLLNGFNYFLTGKPQAARGPTYVLHVHSRVVDASPLRGSIRVGALDSFQSDELDTRAR
jgi:hypothetical protein